MERRKLKIGIDVHGVITSNPIFFGKMIKLLTAMEHEVYILTGKDLGPALYEELRVLLPEIKIHHIFSITMHCKQIGEKISYLDKEENLPMVDSKVWDSAKAWYCKVTEIDIHIDDSDVYGYYFKDIKTQYIHYTGELKELVNTMFQEK